MSTESDSEKFFKSLQIGVALIGLPSLATLSGAVIVHLHQQRYTDIPLPEIPIKFYIAAAIILMVSFGFMLSQVRIGTLLGYYLSKATDKVKEKTEKRASWQRVGINGFAQIIILVGFLWFFSQISAYLAFVALLVLPYFLWCFIYVLALHDFSDQSLKFGDVVLSCLEELIQYLDSPFLLVTNLHKKFSTGLAFFLFFSFYVLIVSASIGVQIYKGIPISWGGGLPSTAHLIFHNEADATQIGLPMFDETHSGTVCLLISGSDNLLVYVPTSNPKSVIKIPENLILAIVDDQVSLDCNPPKR